MNNIVRKIDYMRRLILPKEMTELLKLKPCDLVEITLDEDKICIKPYSSNIETYNFVRNFIITNYESKYHNIKINEQDIINITEHIKEFIDNNTLSNDI